MNTKTSRIPARAELNALAQMAEQISHELVVVTPEMASRWLEGNTHNRNKREQLVHSYARDLEAGAWGFNGETVKFAADGTLLDGQHRLMAIVRAKKPALLLVVSGLPRSAQKTIDTGAARKFADQLGMDGENAALTLSSILRRINLWEAGYRGAAGSYKPTVSELEATLARHPGARESAVTDTPTPAALGCTPRRSPSPTGCSPRSTPTRPCGSWTGSATAPNCAPATPCWPCANGYAANARTTADGSARRSHSRC